MIKLVISFKRNKSMSQQEFRDYRSQVHAPLLLAIPEASLIRKFVVSYPLLETDGTEPQSDAMVEAWFDNKHDLDSLYASENFLRKVDPDHINFIDLSSVGRMVTEEIQVVG